jgi:hypothetical protein
MDGLGVPADVERLAGREVDAGEQRDGKLVAMTVDRRIEVVRSERVLALARSDDHEIRRRVETVMAELRLDDVAVGWERRGVDEHPPPGAVGPEERREQQVQVDAERVRGADLGRCRADDPARRAGQLPLDVDPRPRRIEPAIDPEPRPCVEPLLDRRPRRVRLRAEAHAREIGLRPPVAALREPESIAP